MFFELSGDHRVLHVLTHSFPTRRASELNAVRLPGGDQGAGERHILPVCKHRLLGQYCLMLFGRDRLPGQQSLVNQEAAGVEKPEIGRDRSEEHTSELQSLMRISYAVFCLKKKTTQQIGQK